MKLSRFNAIFNGMNGSAKKVYEAVPKTTHWSQFKIMKELERLGKQMDPAAVKGCLGYMLSMGIVEQDREGAFKRTAIRVTKAHNDEPDDPITTIPTKEETEMATSSNVAEKPAETSAFDILASLVKRCQSIADQVDDLKDDIEKAALAVQAEKDKDAAELGQLRQLKALLSGFNK